MEIEEEKTNKKKNNLNTKHFPPLFMLVAGTIALFVGIFNHYDMKDLLLLLFLSMLIFAILGTIIKSIADGFNMSISYDDYLEDEGEIREK